MKLNLSSLIDKGKAVVEIKGFPIKRGDVTQMPIIGKITTEKIGPFEEETYNIVQIIEEPTGTYYVCNFYYKPGVPQIIHGDMVKEFIPTDKESLNEGRVSWENRPYVDRMDDVIGDLRIARKFLSLEDDKQSFLDFVRMAYNKLHKILENEQ